jgi:hypothetical protein
MAEEKCIKVDIAKKTMKKAINVEVTKAEPISVRGTVNVKVANTPKEPVPVNGAVVIIPTTYEYKFETVEGRAKTQQSAISGFRKKLNELGKQGWLLTSATIPEVFSTHSYGSGYTHTATLRNAIFVKQK